MCSYSFIVAAYFISPKILWTLLIVLLYCIFTRKIYLLLIVLFGCLLGFMRATLCEAQNLPLTIKKNPVVVTGRVLSIPRYRYHAMQFNFLTTQINHHSAHTKLQLKWYGQHPYLQVEDDWELKLKINQKKPFNVSYANWLKSQGLQGRAYVVKSAQNHLINRLKWYESINVARQAMAQKLRHFIDNRALSAVLIALSTGSRNFLSTNNWQVFQNTGTSHLIAISGLHVSLVAGLIYFMVEWLWRRSQQLPLRIAAKKVAAVAALIMSYFYSAFAGWSLPTQRAFLMIAVILLAELSNRYIPLWYRWIFAFTLSLVLWPMAVLSIGFWLSYFAVLIIALCFSARLTLKRHIRQWFYMQYIMFIGLLPLTLSFFGRLSLISIVANCVAVPYMSFLVVPCCLLSSIIFFISPALASYAWWLSAKVLAALWWLLTRLANLPYAVWQHNIHDKWTAIFLGFGVLLLLLPRQLPVRFLSILFIIPAIFA